MSQSQAMSKPSKPQRSGVIIPHKPRWYQRLAARLIFAVIRALSISIRYEWRDTSRLLNNGARQPVIFCVWHNRLALCLEVYRLYIRSVGGEARMAAMVSASKDGGLLARVLELNNVQPARGSTSRRGRQALLELLTWSERGYDLAITPDGPRGPCYVVQDGVISLAQISGLPIVPLSYRLNWKIRVKSWDRFQVPCPFARCQVSVGELVRVPREASDEQRERIRQELERCLKSITLDS